jgi:NhaP-type Na+/H+ or K+/H+ antiporter
LGRYISVTLISFKDKAIGSNKMLMSVVLGRGLAAAVLAEVIRSTNIIGATLISDTIIVVIIVSVVVSTLGTSLIGRRMKRCDSELKKMNKKSSKNLSSIKN